MLPRRCARLAGDAGAALGAAATRRAARRNLPARGRALYGLLSLRGMERAPVARHAGHQEDGTRRDAAAGLRRLLLCDRHLVAERGDEARRAGRTRNPIRRVSPMVRALDFLVAGLPLSRPEHR